MPTTAVGLIITYIHYIALKQGDRRCGHAGAAGSESGSFCYTAFNLDTPYGLEALKIMYKVILDDTVKSPVDLPPIPGIEVVHTHCISVYGVYYASTFDSVLQHCYQRLLA
jgi:hypothetical protein